MSAKHPALYTVAEDGKKQYCRHGPYQRMLPSGESDLIFRQAHRWVFLPSRSGMSTNLMYLYSLFIAPPPSAPLFPTPVATGSAVACRRQPWRASPARTRRAYTGESRPVARFAGRRGRRGIGWGSWLHLEYVIELAFAHHPEYALEAIPAFGRPLLLTAATGLIHVDGDGGHGFAPTRTPSFIRTFPRRIHVRMPSPSRISASESSCPSRPRSKSLVRRAHSFRSSGDTQESGPD